MFIHYKHEFGTNKISQQLHHTSIVYNKKCYVLYHLSQCQVLSYMGKIVF